jgi:hypothetical protein
MRKAVVGLLSMLLSFSVMLFAEEDKVRFSGDATWRYDQYQFHGDPGASPWQFDGQHNYLDLNFRLSNSEPGENWELYFSGVANDSKYRKQFNGFEFETFRFTREYGLGKVPWRLEAGDIYGNFSYRTLQKSLRGFQIEFQPGAAAGEMQSLVFVVGIATPDWKSLESARGLSAGVSWLKEVENDYRFSLNAVFNHRQADPAFGSLDRVQRVFSAAVEKNLQSWPATVEAEYAYFSGDHDGITTAQSGQNTSDRAIYAQLRGNKDALTYRLRFEDNGQDFRPAEALVTPDRRSIEGFLTWRFDRVRDLTLRWQYFRNNQESMNPDFTRLVGVDIRGRLVERWRGSFSAWTQRNEDKSLSFKQKSDALQLNLSRALSSAADLRIDFGWQNNEDRLGQNDVRQSRVSVGVDSSVCLFNRSGRLLVGMANRNVDGAGKVDEWVPTAGLQFNGKRYSASANYSAPTLVYNDPARADVDQEIFNVRYSLRAESGSFGIEYQLFNREDLNSTRAWQLALFYRQEWDRMLDSGRPGLIQGDTGLLYADLRPGMLKLQVCEFLDKKLGKSGNIVNGLTVYESSIFNDVSDRQRLAAEFDNDRLRRLAIAVDPGFAATGVDFMDSFERIRRELVQKLGSPDLTLERGVVSPSLLADIQSGLFIRTFEWNADGGKIRLGLPRRLDGVVRIELQVAANFPAITETLWSLESFY